jgi:hypothetical protein
MDRRKFTQTIAATLAFASLYKFSKAENLLNRKIHSDTDLFFTSIKELSIQYVNNHISDIEWRVKINELYSQYFHGNEIETLSKAIDFKLLKKQLSFGNKGRGRVTVESPLNFESEQFLLKTQLIGIQKGYAIPPHVHENMASCSLILSGSPLVTQFNRLETFEDYVIVEKDSEHYQKQGDWSVVSPFKNNLHWFKAIHEDSFLLNVNVEGLNKKKAKPGIRVDIESSEASSNTYKATIISDEEAQLKYGKLD